MKMLPLPLLSSSVARVMRLLAPLPAWGRPADSNDLEVLCSIPRLPERRTARAKALSTHLDPRGRCALAIRALAATLLDAGQCRSIAITSSRAGEGKSTLAANLAIALAQSGRRVLLVDACVRAPVQREIWSLSDSTGLGDFDCGCGLWTSSIQNSDIPPLDILPRGDTDRNLDEAILHRIVALAAHDYDHVVIDGPAMTNGPASSRVWDLCDVTLMVRRAGNRSAHYSVVSVAPPPSRRIIQRCGSGSASNPQAA